MVDDVLVSLKSKNPQVREGTLKFLHRSLQTTPDAPGKDQVKPMAEALVALLGDSVEPVRSSAAECLGTMMKILGERAFNPYIERVGEIQMGKVKDAFEKAEIRYKAGGAKGPVKPAVKAASLKATAPVVKKVGHPFPAEMTSSRLSPSSNRFQIPRRSDPQLSRLRPRLRLSKLPANLTQTSCSMIFQLHPLELLRRDSLDQG